MHAGGGYELDIAGFERTEAAGSDSASRLTIEIERDRDVVRDRLGMGGPGRVGPNADPFYHPQHPGMHSSAPLLRAVGWAPQTHDALLFIHGWQAGHKGSHHVRQRH